MFKINFKAVVIATVAGFITSGVYYFLLGELAAKYSNHPDAGNDMGTGEMIFEILRTAVLSLSFAWLLSSTKVNFYSSTLLFGFMVWFGFPLMILSGSVVHEKIPWELAAIHSGDWLLKIAVIVLILSYFNFKKNGKQKI